MSADDLIGTPEARRRFTLLFRQALRDQKETLTAFIARVAPSAATIRRALNEPGEKITVATRTAMEKGVGWPEGDIERIITDSTYAPPRFFVYLHPQTSTVEEILKFITNFQAVRPNDFQNLRQRFLDVNWLTPTEETQKTAKDKKA